MANDRAVAVGKAVIKPELDGKAFGKALGELENKTKKIGDKLASVGGTLTKGLTLPIVGAGAAAIGAAAQVDNALRDIRVGTGATGDELAQLQKDFEEVGKNSSISLGRVGEIIADLNTRLGLSGEPLQALAGQVADLEQILGGVPVSLDTLTRVFGAFQVAPEEYAETLDRLFRASQATGVGFDELQGLIVSQSAAFGELGFSLDETVAIIGQFEKAGVNTETVISALRQNIVKAAKEGKTASEFFRDGVQEIEGYLAAGDDAAAQAKASELFGARTFLDALDAIKRGQFDISGTLDQIQNGGDTISGLAEETQTFGQQFEQFKNRITLSLAPLGKELFPILTQAAEQLLPPVIAILDAFANADPNIQRLIIGIAGVAAAIGPVLLIAGKFIKLFGVAIGVIKGVGVAMAFLAANPIVLIIAAIVALVAGLIYAYKNFEGFRNVVDAVFNFVKDLITTVWENVIKPIWNAIAFYITDILIPFYQKLWDVVKAVFEGIKDVIAFVWENVIKPIWDLIEWYIENILIGNFNRFKAIVEAVWNAVSDAISVAWDFISGIFNSIKDGITAVADWIKDKLDTVIGFFTGLKDRITGAVKNVWEGFTNGAKTAFNAIIRLWNNTIGNIRLEVPSWVPGVGGKGFDFPKFKEFQGSVPGLAKGGVITEPTLALVGETAKATPEIVTPERLLREIFTEALEASSNSGTIINNFDVKTATPDELAREIAWRQQRQLTGRQR